jgi:dihydroneopterin aldolase
VDRHQQLIPLVDHDFVFCQGLELDVEIGFHEVERGFKQTVLVDLTLEADFSVGPARDDHAGLVDYYEISRRLEQHVEGRRYDLIEALVVDLARVVVGMHPTTRARVRVTKRPLDMRRTRAVAVECVRSAADFAAEGPAGR